MRTRNERLKHSYLTSDMKPYDLFDMYFAKLTAPISLKKKAFTYINAFFYNDMEMSVTSLI